MDEEEKTILQLDLDMDEANCISTALQASIAYYEEQREKTFRVYEKVDKLCNKFLQCDNRFYL